MINTKYSFKDFMGQDFSSVGPTEFNNSEIVGSCFYQEGDPEQEIFPVGMIGVTFKRCNLDNVKIPAGNTVESDCCHRCIKVQNDLEDWILDGTNNPVEPVAKKIFIRLGLSIDPADIPTDFIREELLTKNDYDAVKNNADFKQWFIDTPAVVNQETKSIRKEVRKALWDATLDKTGWNKDFDTSPVVKANGAKIIIEGNVTFYKIRAKGKHTIKGLKPRPFINISVTQAKMVELEGSS